MISLTPKQIRFIIVVAVAVAFLLISALYNFTHVEAHQQYALLAQSFVEGRLDVLHLDYFSGTEDTVEISGKYYWILGPFPALLLMPFQLAAGLMGTFFLQGLLNPYIILLIFYVCMLLAKKYGFKLTDQIVLAFAFVFGSTFFGVTLLATSHALSHTISVLLVLLALYEYFTRKRYWLIGVYLACAFATRFTAGLAVIFFTLEILFNTTTSSKDKLKKLLLLGSPIIAAGLLLMYYNYARFGDPLDNGYLVSIVVNSPLLAEVRAQYGLFNLKHIFTNIYFFFLATPTPVLQPDTYHLTYPYLKANAYGLSFFITSPIFIKIFFTKITSRIQTLLWIASGAILFVLLIYYAPGYWQYGSRYLLDLLPLWYVLLLYSFREKSISRTHETVILFAAILNVFLFSTLFISIPV